MQGFSAPAVVEPPGKKGRWAAPAGGATGETEGEVRFEQAMSVQGAVAMTGSLLGGSPITVVADAMSKDGTKITVRGFGPTVAWQELKDHFRACGPVAHADVKGQGKGGFGRGRDCPSIGQVRMGSAEEAEKAVQMLNGSQLMGATLEVKLHGGSKDATKLIVTGVPPGAAWQELKDHFSSCGKVEHTDTIPITPGMQLTGEVRFEDPQHAQLALKTLNGSQLGSSQIFIALDQGSTDKTKLIITGISPGTDWQELKDHFSPMGTVAYSDVHNGRGKKGGGKGWGGGGGGGGWNDGKGGGKGGGFGGGWGGWGPSFGGKGSMGGMGGMGCKGGGFGGGGKDGGPAQKFPRVAGAMTGTVRFENPYSAQMALQQMNGTMLNGAQITVDKDWNSMDGTKIWIGGIPPGTGWQELKDMFSQCGPLAYANVNNGKGKGVN